MRLRKSLWASVVGAAVVAVGASTLVAAQAASASADTNRHRKVCIQRDLVEKMDVWYTNMPAAEEVPVGFHSLGFDTIYDTKGKKVGTAAYSMDVIEKRADGHLIAHLAEQVHFPEGAILFTGAFDRTAMFEDGTAVQKVEGLSGVYKGWKGTYTWSIIGEGIDPEAPPPFEVKLVMCNR